MIRAFSILWLAVFLPIIILILPTGVSPIQRLNETFSEKFYIETYQAKFELISAELENLPESQWEGKIRSFAPTLVTQLNSKILRSINQTQSFTED